MTSEQKYQLWLEQVPQGTPVHDELEAISQNNAEIDARFEADLTFGTAGLRGIMGAGTNRMNIYTVRRASLAYGQYIKAAPLPDTCVIAYDTRNHSRLFSEVCATALAEMGIHVYLFPEPMPTPTLSFAVRHLGTGGGVVMTASHNPAAYNGMKCYGSDGCQQTDEPAEQVFALMQTLPMISEPTQSFGEMVTAGMIELLTPSFYEDYYTAVLKESLCCELIPLSGLKVLYTPLHGTGRKPVTTLFDRIGLDYDVVASQMTPDGNFPTCPYPNPETEGAFLEAKKLLETQCNVSYDLVIATDPDADRMAVAVPLANGELHRISGNELGCLLLEFILNNRLRQGTLPNHSKCIKSIVTTPMVLAIAKQYGCENIDVLTGFKYIGSRILNLEQQGREQEVVFAFEESCGFLKGTYARDKDAQIACVLTAALAAACKLDGIDLVEKLKSLYKKYGCYKAQVTSIALDGESGKRLCAEFIDGMRQMPPNSFAGIPVKTISDYREGHQLDCVSGQKSKLDFPKSNVISFALGNQSQIILRPSGTEPKLKVYYFASGDTEQTARRILAELSDDIYQKMKAFGITC